MFIKYLFIIFISLFNKNVLSKNIEQQDKASDSLSNINYLRHQKYSLFAKSVYKKTKSNSFRYETPNQKHGLYFKGIISGRADSFLSTQGLIMNMGATANELKTQNNVIRNWLFLASPIIEAKVEDYIRLYLHPDLGQNQLRLFDANVSLDFFRTFRFMGGLQTALITGFEPNVFNYGGFTRNMSPFKEIAIKMFGEIGPTLSEFYSYENEFGTQSWFYYELAMTNGAADGAFPGLIPFEVSSENNLYQGSQNNTGNKAFEGRVFINPFILEQNHPLQHLGFGFAGSAMTEINRIGLPAFLSIGRNAIFQFNNSNRNFSIAHGRRNRIHPQFLWYRKNIAIVGDYIDSAQQLSDRFNSNINEYPTISQINRAGQALFVWNITGEEFHWQFTKPLNNFRPFDKYNFGGFQLGLRYTVLNIDPNTFNYYDITTDGRTVYKYSDPRTSVQRADGYSVVLNWFWNVNFKLSTEFSYTKFKGGCSTGALNSTITPGCLTAPYSSISQPGSTVLNRPSEIVIFQQATASF